MTTTAAPGEKRGPGRPYSADPIVPFTVGLKRSTWADVERAADAAGLTKIAWVKDAVLAKLAKAGGAGRAKPYVDAKDCLHPQNRRVGNYCLKCGEAVKG